MVRNKIFLAAICLVVLMAGPGWADGNIIRPLIGNEILGSRDVISGVTEQVIEPIPIFAYQPDRSWISAYADGIKEVTYARTSAQTYIDQDGVLRTVPANVPAIENGYVMLEDAATSYYWQPYTESGGAITAIEAPVTRTVTLPSTGNYVLWIDGNASLSVTVAANTAAGTGWGTLTESGSLKLSITTAGTVNVTVSGGAANDIVQLTTGVVKTSYIPTPTSTPVTRTTSGADTSGNGLQVDLTQRMIDVFTGELVPWDGAWTTVSGAPSYSANNKTLTYVGALTASDYHALSATIAAGKQIEVSYTISSYSEGSFKLGFGSGATGVDRTANGTYTERGILSTTTNLYALATAFTGVVKFNYVRRVLDSGQVNPGDGTTLCGVWLPYNSNVIPNSEGISIISSDNSAFRMLTIQRYPTGSMRFVRSSDAINTSTVATEFSAGFYVMIAQYSARTSRMRAGLYNPATDTLTWSSPTLAGATTYRGFFPIHSSNKLRWFYGGGAYPLGIGGCALYDTILTDDEIIRAAQALQ